MASALYRSCQFCGYFFHPSELIRVPEDAPANEQVRLCLTDAEQYLKHLISRADCTYQRKVRRRFA